jgi:hypothetical protein
MTPKEIAERIEAISDHAERYKDRERVAFSPVGIRVLLSDYKRQSEEIERLKAEHETLDGPYWKNKASEAEATVARQSELLDEARKGIAKINEQLDAPDTFAKRMFVIGEEVDALLAKLEGRQ